ncbi:hypothetical protein NQ318_003350 [Aromia moschata]|uniref:Uncharacterized protein n=1 Tax=Aromia moschata TaxID=1265417 RepID=A0AAV8X3K2_9CUCU|nr:hypothetical protein NQ318_003350 [Aromia moschata]
MESPKIPTQTFNFSDTAYAQEYSKVPTCPCSTCAAPRNRGETSPTSAYPPATSAPGRSYFISRSGSGVRPLTKHQSLGSGSQQYKWTSFHAGGEVNSRNVHRRHQLQQGAVPGAVVRPRSGRGVPGPIGVGAGATALAGREQTHRVHGESDRVQFATSQEDEHKAIGLSLQQRAGEIPSEPSRPAYLSLQPRDFDRKPPSPCAPQPELPPSVTPIISPPPAFQDKNKSSSKSRTFFGKAPFLPRSNAIEDSDASPPQTPPPVKWKTAVQSISQVRKAKPTAASPAIEKPPRTFNRIPRRSRWRTQRPRGGPSSSSTTAARRLRRRRRWASGSLDSSFNRPGSIMPRLSENTDSSADVYEDADEEDNNSSSINVSVISSLRANRLQSDFNRAREKVSPSGRANRVLQHRGQIRRSPVGSDTNKPPTCSSPSSSSTSSNEFLSRSPPAPAQQQIRRSAPNRPYQAAKSPSQEDAALQRVRRSRSLQLPEKKPPTYSRESSIPTRVSPQHPDSHRTIIKVGPAAERSKRYNVQAAKPHSLESSSILDEDILREAEVVTGFLYGNRSRAAAQALLMHRYNNNEITKEEKAKDSMKHVNNGLTVYYVGNSKKDKQKVLVRGSTSPSLSLSKRAAEGARSEAKNPCKPDTCDFWPHCANRESLKREAQFVMRSSQSYPTHQRSLDSNVEANRSISTEMERRKQQNGTTSKEPRERRPSPKQTVKRDQSDAVIYEKKSSPMNPRSRTLPTFVTISGSSSGSEAWLAGLDRKGNAKGSGASTPLECALSVGKNEKSREVLLTRPGSAPSEERSRELLVSQQRSMSLPKSFLSASYQQPSFKAIPRSNTIETLKFDNTYPEKNDLQKVVGFFPGNSIVTLNLTLTMKLTSE